MKNLFPIFKNNSGLIYLDNAATTQKPQRVIDGISDYYSRYNSNAKRGIYKLAEETSKIVEYTRLSVANFIGASKDDIVFTSGTTEGVNFIANAWGRKNIKEGDEIVTTILEHHSNFLPWQRLAQENRAIFKIAPVNSEIKLDYQALENLVTSKTKLIAITYQSNVTGEIIDLKRIKKIADKVGARLFVDAAQAIAHKKVDVKDIDCDFLVFSGHKLYGPTGIGILYINKNIVDDVEPYQVGGGMVFEVGEQHSQWLNSPHKFEAGTLPIAQIAGLNYAIDFLQGIDFKKYCDMEKELALELYVELEKNPKIKLISVRNSHIISFAHKDIHAHDLAAYLDQFNICVRAGNHCAQILHKFLDINSSLRISFGVYNTKEDLDIVIKKLKEI